MLHCDFMSRRWLLIALLSVPLLAAVERTARVVRADSRLPTGRAEWIWARGGWWRHAAPATFWAARDLDLPTDPRAARLLVRADEEYVLFVNGNRVGSGRMADGEPADVYDVAAELRGGANRIVLELHSERGSGGVLLELEADGGPLLVSDESWRILRNLPSTVLAGLEPLPRGEPAVSWGVPPVGRWSIPRPGAARLAGWQLADGAWIDGERRALGGVAAKDGRPAFATLFTWRAPVKGYLRLRFAQGTPGEALLFLGDEPPIPGRRRAESVLMAPAGGAVWHGAVARPFRYALVVGAADVAAATVEPAVPAAVEAPSAALRGVFGVAPPPLGAPMEDEIRRELEGLAGLARREEG